MKTFSIDLMRLPSSGHGFVRIPAAGLCVGGKIGVRDEDTDVFEAEVLSIVDGQVEIQIHWDRVLEHV